MAKRKREDLEPYDRLVEVLEQEHKGYKSQLVCREVPGSGRGLFAAGYVAPGDVLLEIPASAMINPLTLCDSTIPSHLFPRPAITKSRPRSDGGPTAVEGAHGPLTTTQLLTLHLALCRADLKSASNGGDGGETWRAYLDTLPLSFRPWHPLTWLIEPDTQGETGEAVKKDWAWWRALGACLPGSTRAKLAAVEKRLWRDIKVLKGAIASDDCLCAIGQSIPNDTFLWAWLNVNTRTVSIPLGLPAPTDEYNHTLVPILDMMNHSSAPSSTIPRPIQIPSSSSHQPYAAAPSAIPHPRSHAPPGRVHGRNGPIPHLVPGRIGFRLVAPPRGIKEGEEVFFEYGGHSNATLFAEYGFIELPAAADADGTGEDGDGAHASNGEEEEVDWLRLSHGEVDVGGIVDEIWAERRSEEKRATLESIGCWGRNSLYSHPRPTHPSYALLMTLRVLHLSDDQKLGPISRGGVSYVSPENEAMVNASLADICNKVIAASVEGLKRLDGIELEGNFEREVAVSLIRGLWEEERVIAGGVKRRVEKGDTSW